jgi:hypothetical protein
MRILEYAGLETSRVARAYQRVTAAIARGDLHAAQAKKMQAVNAVSLYRAKLDDADRLLFCFVRHGGEVCALMLEVIENHAYEKSRFLDGSPVDEAKLIDPLPAATDEAQPLVYLHPSRTRVQMLDKPISFDDAQDAIYSKAPPLIIVGGAGSGKTALTLEKMKQLAGEVLYVTHSRYLTENARSLYYSNRFDRADQAATFLCYSEFVQSIRMPLGREANWREFTGWFMRMRQSFREFDPHQLFEEFRGVITAEVAGPLSRAAYLALGVKQSIFPTELRDRVYDLYERYRAWLVEAGLFDPNIVANDWVNLAEPMYDFIVIDEIQDMTPVQLALILKTLKSPGQFLLCGDANQIVHPNFFSWSRVKTMFWRDPALANRQELAVLATNFRNGVETTRVANTLLKIKQKRLGSTDRESNFLVQAVTTEPGKVALLNADTATIRDLDQKTRLSAKLAVIVMRDEDKAAASKCYSTPLLFSIHEAKGLEYDNIVIHCPIADNRNAFSEIASGLTKSDLAGDELAYARGRDKQDKSLEIYKFYVNALYVAVTRAVRNVYWVETDVQHAFLGLLGILAGAGNTVEAGRSSVEEWQREARKLELQGKQEQADAIRKQILKQIPVPWTVMDDAFIKKAIPSVFVQRAPGSKIRQQLAQYAAVRELPILAGALALEGNPKGQIPPVCTRIGAFLKHLEPFQGKGRDVIQLTEKHGVDYRTPTDLTPLMAAARVGNLYLVNELLARGANIHARDHYGQQAIHHAFCRAIENEEFAQRDFAAMYERLAPATIDLRMGDRLIKFDRTRSEYLVFQTLWCFFIKGFCFRDRHGIFFKQKFINSIWAYFPTRVLSAERRRGSYLSQVLARNEVQRSYAYNRYLFRRVAHGAYNLNPQLMVRGGHNGDEWIPIANALNTVLLREFCDPHLLYQIDFFNRLAGITFTEPPPLHARFGKALHNLITTFGELDAIELAELERLEAELVAERAALSGTPLKAKSTAGSPPLKAGPRRAESKPSAPRSDAPPVQPVGPVSPAKKPAPSVQPSLWDWPENY